METTTEKFRKTYGQDLLEEIFECFWNRQDSETVTILETKMYNIGHAFFSGYFRITNDEISFDAEFGCEIGCIILRYEDDAKGIDDIRTPKWRFIPSHSNSIDKK